MVVFPTVNTDLTSICWINLNEFFTVPITFIFPNDLSVLRLMGALLIEQNEKWAAGPRYLNMTVYHGIEKDDNSEEAGMLKLVK